MREDLNHSESFELKHKIIRVINWIHEFFSGAALSWTSVPYLMLRRHETERLFALAFLLNLHGLSPLPARYRLWMLLEMTPQIMYWRRKLLLWDEDLEMADLKHIGH